MSSRSQLILGILLAATGFTLFLTVATSANSLEDPTGPSSERTAEWVSGPVPTDSTPPSATPTPDPTPAPAPTRFATLVLPRSGAQVPVVRGTDAAALASGAGQWDNGTEPGGKGNVVIVTAPGDATAGAGIDGLRRGDRVVLQTAAYRYVYVMDTRGDAFRVPGTARWPLVDSPGPTRADRRRVLTLVTATGSDPAADRLIAFGHLRAVHLRPGAGSRAG
ncbi:sortase [Nocardioides rubriscoriae]|uniref:sortase n=1 Tax=Nocardioides rubriscoriae TaxID=642762 RepID=UPI0011DF9F59|nr:class E sortase [Nocardioides rubriscoriae]